MKSFFKLAMLGYSQIFLSDSWRVGVFVFGLTFIKPNLGLAGLFSVCVALGLGWLLGWREPYQWPSYFARNATLIGFSVGYYFRLDLLVLPLLLIASIGTFMLTVALARALNGISVPLVSLPFSMASIFMSLATRHYSHLYNLESIHSAAADLGPEAAPLFLKGFFQALSYVLFQKDFWVGAVITLMILSYSRILCMTLFAGYLLGCFVQSLPSGSWDEALLNPLSFNYAYASACIAAIFLIPSPVSVAMAVISVLMSVLCLDAFTNFLSLWSLPVSALPFNVSVILTMHTLIYFNSKWRTKHFGRSPEESFEKLDSRIRRFGYPDVSIELPFLGAWKVYQGFKGGMTHQGVWQYALDFVRSSQSAQPASEDHQQTQWSLENFPSFGADVLAPCSGTIAAVEKAIADNPIGQLNESKNWGNYVMLRSDSGFYVSLCHLKKDSIEIQVGDYVTAGRIIGQCGNSGYSAEPHLHVQAHWVPYFSAATIPFRLSSYIHGVGIEFHKVPRTGDLIGPLQRNRALDYAFSWPSGRKFVFQTQRDKAVQKFEVLTVVTDPQTGRSCLKDAKDNQLFFWQEPSFFYFYDFRGSGSSFLAKLFAATPRIPLSYSSELEFQDVHPPEIAWGSVLEIFAQIGRLFGSTSHPTGRYRIDSSGTKISGRVRYLGKLVDTSAIIDPNHGIKWLKIANEEFLQVNQ